jgi:arginine deiminase
VINKAYNSKNLFVSQALHRQAEADHDFSKNLRADDPPVVELEHSLQKVVRILDVA